MSIDNGTSHRKATRKKQRDARECMVRTVFAASGDMPGLANYAHLDCGPCQKCLTVSKHAKKVRPARLPFQHVQCVVAHIKLNRERKARAQGMILLDLHHPARPLVTEVLEGFGNQSR